MPFEGIKIHAKFVSSLRAKRSNRLGLLRCARNDRRDIFNSYKNSMNRKSPNFVKVNTLAVGIAVIATLYHASVTHRKSKIAVTTKAQRTQSKEEFIDFGKTKNPLSH
jgi:hypothetical protein